LHKNTTAGSDPASRFTFLRHRSFGRKKGCFVNGRIRVFTLERFFRVSFPAPTIISVIRTASAVSQETEMNHLDRMLQSNKDFAAQQSAAGTLMPSLPKALPNVKAIVITCADPRVDPAYILGIKPGDAVVIRNIGGRVTPGLLEQLGLLGRIGEVAGEIPGGGGEFHIVVMHHTDCGMTRLPGDPALLAHYFQIQEGELKTKAVTDPRAAVAADVAVLRAVPALPDAWLISGLVYDVATGVVETVVAPARIRTARNASAA
jgi:carbonic anhydrase